MSCQRLVIRVNHANPNHHLWENHGTWWMHYTLHLPDFTKRRIRQSLATKRVGIARRRRDAVLSLVHADTTSKSRPQTMCEQRHTRSRLFHSLSSSLNRLRRLS